MKTPKIALVHEFLNFFGGADQILFKFHELYPDAPIYCLLADEDFVAKHLPNATVIPSYLNRLPRFLTHKHQLFAFEFPIAIEQFDLSDFDIVLSDSHGFSKGVITKPSTVHISYIHSPTRYIWDQNAAWVHQKNLSLLSPYIYYRFNKLRDWDYLAADRVDMFLANSNHVAKRIKKYYRRPSVTVYPWVDVESYRPNTPVQKEDYYFIVSRLVEFKNFDIAVKAFNKLGKRLVIAGTGSAEAHLKSIAKDNIEFLGFVSDEKKIELLQKAKAFVWTCEEDFGIVPVESMAAGTPVVSYGVGGQTESIVDGVTGLFFDQENPESLIDAIKKFEKTNIMHNQKECIDQAQKFDISNFKQQINDIVQQAAQNPQAILNQSIYKQYSK